MNLKHLKIDDLIGEDEYDPDVAVSVGDNGLLVTNNEFIHWVEKEGLVQIEVFKRGSFNSRIIELNEDEAVSRLTNEVNLSEWGHYWGIKTRMAHNYSLMLKSLKEIGVSTKGFPKFGD